LFGVADKPPRQVVGTKAINNPVGMEEKLFAKLGFRVDVEEVLHPDGRVVVFHVLPRPLGTAYHLDGRYLMRSGGKLTSMSEDQLRRIFAEGKPNWLEEISMQGLDAQKVVELLDTQAFFSLLKLPYPTNQAGVIGRLVHERLVKEQDGHYAIIRLGALLLAKNLSAFPELSRRAPRVVVYKGNSKLDTILDRSGARGYAVGFQSRVKFIMAQLPQNEVIEDALRKEMKLLPEITIRELFANAIIHQDFSVSGIPIMVEIYSNRVEISNPGEPVMPVERFIDGWQSRNEDLAELMRRMGICEAKSSGIDNVISAVEHYQLPAPRFRADCNRTTVTIFGHKEFEDMDRDDRIRACYQHCALKWVMSENMTNQSLRERFRLTESKSAIVSQIIAHAIDAGAIKLDVKVGASRKYARYLPFWA